MGQSVPVWSELINRGLRPVPRPPLAWDVEVPVAIWRDANSAAVLVLALDGTHATEPHESAYSQCIAFVQLTERGWESVGAGPGSDWPLPYGERFEGSEPEFTGFAGGQTLPGGVVLWFRSGIAPIGVEKVAVHLRHEHQEVTVEPVTGAFLVRVPSPQAEPAIAIVRA